MKKRNKIPVWAIILIILALIIIGLVVYMIFFTNAVSYFGFTSPEYSPSAKLGEIGAQASGNAWEDANLNPFSNST